MKVYYDEDIDPSKLKKKKIAIIGYGSQGHAHAQNLRDSGVSVTVADIKDSANWKKAKEAGFNVKSVSAASKSADIVVLLAPDTYQPAIYHEHVEKNLVAGNALMFSHGFNIHYGQIKPPAGVDVFMVAPKAPGHTVRDQYVGGAGVPGLVAVHQDPTGNAKDLALAYARAIGCSRAGVIETTFKDETETDLFGEQSVLCGGLTALILAGYETLVEAGYPPEMAYFECCHEVKLIVDLIYEGGIANMRYSVSDTAKFGDITRGPRLINDSVKQEMKKIIGEIQSGEFATEWILENQAGRPTYNALLRQGEEHPIESVGAELRGMMSSFSRKGWSIKTRTDGFSVCEGRKRRTRHNFGLRCALCSLLASGVFFLFVVFVLLTAFFVFFFRDPERELPPLDPGSVICPADGKVIDISEVSEDDYLKRNARRISIFLSIFDCHINRFPVSGKVVGTTYYPGNSEWLLRRILPMPMSGS